MLLFPISLSIITRAIPKVRSLIFYKLRKSIFSLYIFLKMEHSPIFLHIPHFGRCIFVDCGSICTYLLKVAIHRLMFSGIQMLFYRFKMLSAEGYQPLIKNTSKRLQDRLILCFRTMRIPHRNDKVLFSIRIFPSFYIVTLRQE